MIPLGYNAKTLPLTRPESMDAPNVVDVFSVSSCVNNDFFDYIPDWKHNGYWFFDSPDIIRDVATAHHVTLGNTKLFYYEAQPIELHNGQWRSFESEKSMETRVVVPTSKQLEGFDVVTFSMGNDPECSPLSCNCLAMELPTNSHCLFATSEEAAMFLESGAFDNSEPGPYRIYAVFSVDWP
jgi:hypothetical protein